MAEFDKNIFLAQQQPIIDQLRNDYIPAGSYQPTPEDIAAAQAVLGQQQEAFVPAQELAPAPGAQGSLPTQFFNDEQAALLNSQYDRLSGEPIAGPVDVDVSSGKFDPVTLPPPPALGGSSGSPRVTRTVRQENLILSPAQQQQMQKASKAAESAQNLREMSILKEGEAEAEALNVQSQITQEAILNQEQNEAAFKQEQQELQDRLDQKLNNIELINQDISSERINPDRYFENQSTGRKVGNAIAIFFGSMAGDDTVFNSIQRAVREDIAAQRADIANRRAGVNTSLNLYDRSYQALGDRQAAERASYAFGLQIAEKKAEAMAQEVKSDAVRARAVQLVARLRQEKAQNMQAAIEQSAAKEVTEQRFVSGGGGGDSIKRRMDLARLEKLERDNSRAALEDKLGSPELVDKLIEYEKELERRQLLGADELGKNALFSLRKLNKIPRTERGIARVLSKRTGDLTPDFIRNSISDKKTRETVQKALSNLYELVQNYQTRVTGAGASDSERMQFKKDLAGLEGQSLAQATDFVMRRIRKNSSDIRSLRSAYPEVVWRTYEAQRKNLKGQRRLNQDLDASLDPPTGFKEE